MKKTDWSPIGSIRVGSFVYVIPYDKNEENCTIVKVNSRTKRKIGYCNPDSNNENYRLNEYIKGIPFDKEIRKKIGFAENEFSEILELENHEICYHNDGVHILNKHNGYLIDFPIEYIQFVHEFQNLLDLARVNFKFDIR